MGVRSKPCKSSSLFRGSPGKHQLGMGVEVGSVVQKMEEKDLNGNTFKIYVL